MKTLVLGLTLGLLMVGMSGPVHGQAEMGVWGGYTYFPYTEYSDADVGGSRFRRRHDGPRYRRRPAIARQ